MRPISFWAEKYYRRAVQLFGSQLYKNPEPDLHRSILVAGTARSGTTWLGDLIAAQIPCRVMFEPFHPELVKEYRTFQYFQYMRPEGKNGELHDFAQKVFTGQIRDRWIDRQNESLFPKYRLIKEIRANLMLKWLRGNFPQVPVLLLLRHPCAVVQSRMQLGWATDRDIEPFLSQPELVADHLLDHLNLIRSAETEEEKHAIIWCVSNLVPLKQLRPSDVRTVYYENLLVRPEVELPAMFEYLGYDYDASLLERMDRPSQTTIVTSAVVSGASKISYWKKVLTPAQIERILKIVREFGLGYLYNDSPLPLPTALESQLTA